MDFNFLRKWNFDKFISAFVTLVLLLNIVDFAQSLAIRQHSHGKHLPQPIRDTVTSLLKASTNHSKEEKLSTASTGKVPRQKKCPDPQKDFPDEACVTLSCVSDEDCKNVNETCCFNGCLYSCSMLIDVPPLIDWETLAYENVEELHLDDMDYEIETGEELMKNHRYGDETAGDLCTTTVDEDGSLPLACPHGYFCKVENPGDPDRNIPNSGSCILLHPESDIYQLPSSIDTEDFITNVEV